MHERAYKLEWLKYREVDWWTAVLFLIGSCFWVANGVIVFHEPINDEQTSYKAASSTGFLGGTFFLFGGWCMYLQGLNDNETDKSYDLNNGKADKSFRWWGWKNFRDQNFMACVTQNMGTNIFWISVLADLPGILPMEEDQDRPAYNGAFWTPQVVGAFFLTVSSVLLTLNSQKFWFLPKLNSLGWHVGFWNLIGSVGFFLSGLFGLIYTSDMKHERLWGVSFTTYVGSYSFLLGSVLQYIESIYVKC